MNDMVDIKGFVEDKSVEKSGALLIEVVGEMILLVAYVSVPIDIIELFMILHLSSIDSVTVH